MGQVSKAKKVNLKLIFNNWSDRTRALWSVWFCGGYTTIEK